MSQDFALLLYIYLQICVLIQIIPFQAEWWLLGKRRKSDFAARTAAVPSAADSWPVKPRDWARVPFSKALAPVEALLSATRHSAPRLARSLESDLHLGHQKRLLSVYLSPPPAVKISSPLSPPPLLLSCYALSDPKCCTGMWDWRCRILFSPRCFYSSRQLW